MVSKVAAKDGLQVNIVDFTDYIRSNAALAEGDLDIDIYQHRPFLDSQIKSRGYKLVPVGSAVVQQLGVYSKKHRSLADAPLNARIAIPNDPSNEARALFVLDQLGLIKIKHGTGSNATPRDILENPKNFRIVEVEEAQLARFLDDVDFATVNSNYAIPAGFSPVRDALALESKDSPYAVILIVAREDNKSDPDIGQFIKAYHSNEVKAFIEKTFSGSYLPAWE